jgi:hypothetical protein
MTKNIKPNEADLLNKLNDSLVNNNLEFIYEFSLSMSSGSILIYLHEINEQGWKILIFNSCDGFIPIVEEQWEKDTLTWNEAVLLQIKFNLTKMISDIGQILQLFTSDFILKKEEN